MLRKALLDTDRTQCPCKPYLAQGAYNPQMPSRRRACSLGVRAELGSGSAFVSVGTLAARGLIRFRLQ